MGFEVSDMVNLEPGAYRAKLTKIEERDGTNYETGDPEVFRSWVFEITEEGYEKQEIFGNSTMAFGPKSKAREWVEALMGRKLESGEKFEYEDLYGKEVDLGIVLKDTDRGTFPRINAINPVRKKSRATEKAEAKGKQAPPSKLDAATADDLDSIPFN